MTNQRCAGPLAEELSQLVGEIARRGFLGPELDAAGLELHEMHVGVKMGAQHRLAVLVEEFDHLEEALRLGRGAARPGAGH